MISTEISISLNFYLEDCEIQCKIAIMEAHGKYERPNVDKTLSRRKTGGDDAATTN